MKAFDPQWIAFRNFVKTGIQFAVYTKTLPWFLSPLNSVWTEHPTTFVGSSPSERNSTLDTHGLNILVQASCVLLKAEGDLARPAGRKPGNER